MKKILIIDDESDVGKVISLMLNIEHPNEYSVAVALNGKEGLKKMQKEKFDLLLLDMMMPQMSGQDVLDQMAKHRINLPVIVITAVGWAEPVKNNLINQYKIREMVSKPHIHDLLFPAIQRVLG
jgi:CheY-like chemotaxis protein